MEADQRSAITSVRSGLIALLAFGGCQRKLGLQTCGRGADGFREPEPAQRLRLILDPVQHHRQSLVSRGGQSRRRPCAPSVATNPLLTSPEPCIWMARSNAGHRGLVAASSAGDSAIPGKPGKGMKRSTDGRRSREILGPGTADEGHLGVRKASANGSQRWRRAQQIAEIERLKDRDPAWISGKMGRAIGGRSACVMPSPPGVRRRYRCGRRPAP